MRREGRLLLELLVALPLLGVLGLALTGLLVTQVRMARVSRERAARAEAARVSASVLRGDLRWLRVESDVQAWSADSIRLRAFRGVATPCGRQSLANVQVKYSGLRAADPSKDSVLSLTAGGETVHELRAVRDTAGDCQARNQSVQLWQLDPPLSDPGILLPFETGTYSLNDGALRYRIGRAGRQPITEEILDLRRSNFAAEGMGGDTAQPSFLITLSSKPFPLPATTRSFRIRLLNARR